MSKKIVDKKEKKKCFVITPIGNEGSPERIELTGLIDSVLNPLLAEEYEVRAAHLSVSSVLISKEIIEDIYNADLIIANLTGANPNVMYELAFAHAARKPVIQIIRQGQEPPFDVRDFRYVEYTDSLLGASELKETLKEYIDQAIKDADNGKVSNPITDSIDSFSVKSETHETSVVEVLESVTERLDIIEKNQRKSTMFDKGLANYETSRDELGNKIRTRTLVFEAEVTEKEVKNIQDFIFKYWDFDIHKMGITSHNDELLHKFEVRYSYTGLYDDFEFERDLRMFCETEGVRNFKILS